MPIPDVIARVTSNTALAPPTTTVRPPNRPPASARRAGNARYRKASTLTNHAGAFQLNVSWMFHAWTRARLLRNVPIVIAGLPARLKIDAPGRPGAAVLSQ